MANLFSNRELAIGVWAIIGLCCALFSAKIRKSIFQFMKTAASWRLIILYLAIFIYCSMMVFVLYSVCFWEWSFLKDTIVWAIASGFGILLRHQQNNGFKNYLKEYIIDVISITAIVIFISSSYTFDLWIELITMPFLFILGGMQAVAENNSKYKAAAKVLQALFVIYGFIAIAFSLHGIINDFQEFFTTETLRNFLLPIVLLVMYIPFYYAYALYCAYETVHIQLKWPIRKDVSAVRYLKRKVFKYIGINLFKMERFCEYRQYAIAVVQGEK